MNNPPFNEWTPGFKASDIPVTPGGDPSPFADLDDTQPEDETYSNSDVDTRKLAITLIKDETGAEMRRIDVTLPVLAEHIRFQTATGKMQLPWLKLAIFGNKRSEKNSLRTNENTLQISGVEVEHDAGEIAFGTALATILKAGIRCIIYTSPSYVPGVKERWRILVPLSQNREPEVREKFVARVNGLFGGKLAPESFVLSQAYLYGSVNNNPHHRVEVIDGRFLDLRDDLYARSIYKDGSRVGGNGNGAGIDLNGAGPQHRSRANDDPQPTDRDKIEAALDVISSDCSYEVWLKVGGALHHALGEAGFELFDRWSAKAPGKYNASECRERWRGARTMHSVTDATIFYYADQADQDWRQRYEGEEKQRAYARMAEGADDSNGSAGTSSGAGTGNKNRLSNDIVTEQSAARQFAEEYGEQLRYCRSAKQWFRWSGAIWGRDERGGAYHWAGQLSSRLGDDQNAATRKNLGRAAFANGVEKFAQHDPRLVMTADDWNGDPMLLGTPGGTVDLQTGELQESRREDCITKTTSVAPIDEPCPRWIQFLIEATGNDAGLIRFLQQWCGYGLTGLTREHALVFVYGPGGNGKGVFLNTTQTIMKDYAVTAAMDTFTASKSDKHPTDLAMLQGARFVTASETEEGRAWAEARIKQMTGGDRITAHFMRQDNFTFTPQFKLTIIGNHQPVLHNVDDAAKRRFNIVPFLLKPAEVDRELEAKLMREAGGILKWMITGCLGLAEERPDPARERQGRDGGLLLRSGFVRTMDRGLL